MKGLLSLSFGMAVAAPVWNPGPWPVLKHYDADHLANIAEPLGYLAATQSPDGTIHLLSSGLHYRFNLPWLLTKPSAPLEK